MAIPKGKSGNPNGRPKGSKNRLPLQVRGVLAELVEKELDNLPALMESLPAKERIQLLGILLPYVLPKLKPVSDQPESDNSPVVVIRMQPVAPRQME